jgi:hypothetical protein
MSTRGRSAADYAAEQGTDYPQQAPQHAERTGGGGAVAGAVLAGILMMLSGLYGVLAGLAMVLKRGFFLTPSGYAYNWSTVNWGWTELIVGAVVFLAGACVIVGMTWARVVGVIVATLSAVASFLALPYYPVWSIILIAVDVFIIWALVSYGRRSRA